MSKDNEPYQIIPFPKIRRLMVDGGRIGRQKHIVHGLVEFDVTCARRAIGIHKQQTGETLSFTAFILACLGQAVELNKHMHAFRTWREKLVIFDEVDVNTMFEVEVGGHKKILPHIIRAVNNKSVREIHEEIRLFQAQHESSLEAKFIDWFVLLPGFIRRFFLGVVLKSPRWRKDMHGTVAMTAVGMFGSGGGWALPVSDQTLQITLGGIGERPGFVGDQIEKREYLSVTISFDHDIIDGGPAARFTQRLKELIESSYGLDEMIGSLNPPGGPSNSQP
jgi:pyruvate/2-oxoglutarate dehydrogenase complex dihydrolipoamide acyltransferase (E2) component